MPPFRPCALILAAGAGRRMGAPKALVDFKGKTFLDRALDLCTGFQPMLVVLDPRAGIFAEASRAALSRGARVVENPHADQGMLSSIKAGLAAVPEDASHLVIQPVDHPGVVAGTVELLRQAAEENPRSIVVPSFENRRGHPGFFPREFFAALMAAGEEEGARAVLRDNSSRIVHVVVGDAATVRDIDRPADLPS